VGEWVLTHVSWDLLWASIFAGVVFLVAHASYMVLSAHRKREAHEADALERALPVCRNDPKHSLAARLSTGSWRSRCSCLLATAFSAHHRNPLPMVQWHWMAGLLLTASILFHIVHATFWLDFWSIGWDRRTFRVQGRDSREIGHEVAGPEAGNIPWKSPVPNGDPRGRASPSSRPGW